VSFSPDHPRDWAYHQKLRVDVPNQVQEHVIALEGWCHAQPLYARAKDLEDVEASNVDEAMEDCFALPAGLGDLEAEMRALLGIAARPPTEMVLTFPRELDASGASSKALLCGGCVMAGAGGAGGKGGASGGGSFEVLFDEETKREAMFKVAPEKGAVKDGEELEMAFTFTPPVVKESGLAVGQWTTNKATVRLVGGGETRDVSVVLRGYVSL